MNNLVENLPKNPLHYLAAYGAFSLGVSSIHYLQQMAINAYLFFNKFKLDREAKLLVESRNQRVKEFLAKYKDQISEKRMDQIVYLTASALIEKIKKKEIKSREAVIAFSIRAATIGIELFLINDVFFEEAIAEAEAADELISNCKDVSTLPPLIGLPMTIKDVVLYKGKNCTLGYKFLAGKKATYDSHVVAILKKAGAIPICYTNIPQGLFACEASNYLWGASQNPWDRSRTPGGSSGGCGGCVSSFCSPLSFTGDIGGSTRIPASFTGLYGLKPSSSRITSKDQIKLSGDEYSGWKTWMPSPGTLTRCFEDCLLFAKTLYGNFPEDFTIPQKTFDEKAYINGLTNYFDSSMKSKIGICYGFSLSEPFQEQIIALDNIKSHFKSLGHEVVNFNFEQFLELFNKSLSNIAVVLGLIDLGLRGEKPYYYYRESLKISKMGYLRNRITRHVLKAVGNHRIAKRYDAIDSKLLSTYNFLSNAKYIDELKENFYSYLRAQKIDCIIMPVLPFPAPLHNKFIYQYDHFFYTMLPNILNLSAGAIPIKLIEDITYNTKYNDSISTLIKANMKGAKGLPFAVQVLTLPYQDEKCLCLMKETDNVYKFSQNQEAWDKQKERVKSYRK